MNVIKRNGTEVEFDCSKIEKAISLANDEAPTSEKMSASRIKDITSNICKTCFALNRAISVEEIQDIVENSLMESGAFQVAKYYIRYRYEHNLRRQANTTDSSIMSLVEYENEDVKQENSNKDPEIIPTQRDYMAGEVSKDLTMRMLLPKDIVDAHKAGIIHFHDSDYFLQHSHNCDLLNLDDMLQNGTVISGTLIERPHSFSTACNIATQIIAQVASSQYGGQSFSVAHLAPFVEESRKRIRKELEDELRDVWCSGVKRTQIVEKRLREEIKRGVQTIQYQIITLMTTNGQAPFVTAFMYLNEAEGQTQKDLAMIIEEMLNQRIEGVKNEKGVWITPAFPKLIYVLDDNNITPKSEFWYLTVLAAKCTAKRMVPDYISAKVMRELKNGDVYTCMG